MKISCLFQKSSDLPVLQFGADVGGSAGGLSDCVSRSGRMSWSSRWKLKNLEMSRERAEMMEAKDLWGWEDEEEARERGEREQEDLMKKKQLDQTEKEQREKEEKEVTQKEKKQRDIGMREKQQNENKQMKKEQMEKEEMEKKQMEKEEMEKKHMKRKPMKKEQMEKEQMEKEKMEKEQMKKGKMEKKQMKKEHMGKEPMEKGWDGELKWLESEMGIKILKSSKRTREKKIHFFDNSDEMLEKKYINFTYVCIKNKTFSK